MIKISKYLKQKGQGIVEYALLLAFVVGIAVALQGVGLKDAIVGAFDDVATVLANATKTNLYADNFAKYSKSTKAQLQALNNAERIDTDLAALHNLADFVVGKNMSELEEFFQPVDGQWESRIKQNGGLTVFESWDNEHGYNSTGQLSGHYTRSDGMINLMYGGTHDIQYISGQPSNGQSYVQEKYFYSDAMIGNDSGKNERAVKLSVDVDSSGTVTGARAWVTGLNNKNVVTANGSSLTDVGSDGQSNLFDGVKLGTKK